jgi:hypothetical protein
MPVLINPGAGSVPDATERNAEENAAKFVADLTEKLTTLPPQQDGRKCSATIARDTDCDDSSDGRFEFILTISRPAVPHSNDQSPAEADTYRVSMPGCALNKVRFRSGEGPLPFALLEIDGNNWYWPRALSLLADITLLKVASHSAGSSQANRRPVARTSPAAEL